MPSRPEKTTTRPATPEPLLRRLLRELQQRWLAAADSPAVRTDPDRETTETGQSTPVPAAADNRRQPRVPLKNTSVHVTDGCLCTPALIDNISPSGICLCNLPEQLYRSASQLTVFSNDNPGLPVLHIEPRWQRTDWGGKTIGAVILNGSDSWRLFFVHAASQAET